MALCCLKRAKGTHIPGFRHNSQEYENKKRQWMGQKMWPWILGKKIFCRIKQWFLFSQRYNMFSVHSSLDYWWSSSWNESKRCTLCPWIQWGVVNYTVSQSKGLIFKANPANSKREPPLLRSWQNAHVLLWALLMDVLRFSPIYSGEWEKSCYIFLSLNYLFRFFQIWHNPKAHFFDSNFLSFFPKPMCILSKFSSIWSSFLVS